MIDQFVKIKAATRPGAGNTETGLTKPLDSVEVQLMNILPEWCCCGTTFPDRATCPTTGTIGGGL